MKYKEIVHIVWDEIGCFLLWYFVFFHGIAMIGLIFKVWWLFCLWYFGGNIMITWLILDEKDNLYKRLIRVQNIPYNRTLYLKGDTL